MMKANMSPKVLKAIAVAGVTALIAVAAATPSQARYGENAAAAGAGFAAGAVVGSAVANNAAYGYYGPGDYGPGAILATGAPTMVRADRVSTLKPTFNKGGSYDPPLFVAQ
jgi:hypothetical protein